MTDSIAKSSEQCGLEGKKTGSCENVRGQDIYIEKIYIYILMIKITDDLKFLNRQKELAELLMFI